MVGDDIAATPDLASFPQLYTSLAKSFAPYLNGTERGTPGTTTAAVYPWSFEAGLKVQLCLLSELATHYPGLVLLFGPWQPLSSADQTEGHYD
jgi:hypothetical protein